MLKLIFSGIIIIAFISISPCRSTDSLLNFLKTIKIEILQKHPYCTNLVTFVEASCTICQQPSNQENSNPLETYLSSNLIPSNASNSQDETEVLATKYHSPCSLFLYDISKILEVASNETLNFESWPPSPNALSAKSYYIFLVQNLDKPSEQLTDLKCFAKTTRKFHQVFFAIAKEQEVDVYALKIRGNELVIISSYNLHSENHSELLVEVGTNFEGGPFVAALCPICDKALERFKESGMWEDYVIGLIYEFIMKVNGTIEVELVFGDGFNGMTEDGEWNEYITMTFDDSIQLSMVLQPTHLNRKVIYISNIVFYDNICFMTHLPTIAHIESLMRLIQPLKLDTWLGMVVDIVLIFVSIEMAIAMRRYIDYKRRETDMKKSLGELSILEKQELWKQVAPHSFFWTILALFRSAVDQSAESLPKFAKNVSGSTGRFLIALWYVTVIVIGCGYKSNLTSMIVKPTISEPPLTFEELAKSKYDIGAVFYKGDELSGYNNSAYNEVNERVKPYDFLDPDCYLYSFTKNAVCIATRLILYSLSARLGVDVYGRLMFQFSKEKLFPIMLGMGLSKWYPMLLEPLNDLILNLQCTGIYEKWMYHTLQGQVNRGREKAINQVKYNPMYKGLAIDNYSKDKESSGIILYLQILCIGFSLSVIGLLLELIKYWSTCKSDAAESMPRSKSRVASRPPLIDRADTVPPTNIELSCPTINLVSPQAEA